MNPADLTNFLGTLVRSQLKLSTMIWGPPGIGKSSIVAQVAAAHGLECIDLRLSQLAPTDLRGLPVAKAGRSHWYPPEFLPGAGAGVLFLDEINMAPPTMQGMAQQLILDRKVGSYSVPEGWFIWAAGNREEDRAAVFDMPAPLANRFLHVEVSPDFENFKAYALARGLHEHVVAFLSFRPALLHKSEALQPAWPSPRSWEMASQLHAIGLDVAAAVGAPTASEFNAFVGLYGRLPDIEQILAGHGDGIAFPDEPSVRYATTVGLTARAADAQAGYHALRWLARVAAGEWVQLCAADLFKLMRAKGQWRRLKQIIGQDAELRAWFAEHQRLLEEPSAGAGDIAFFR
ncbi:MAG TPA: MoxR family ATPase [Kouleothrix sp.]|uniref:ATP-binding protein n=1 Tax=Kouleothrix sp. TaxID=2779161 RepID=UPI002BF3B4D3|nr:MoxR family ATPase [Kouleothrix sp.]